MKQKLFFVVLISAVVALPLLTCALFGPPRLVVKPGAASHLDELLKQWTSDGTFTGSVLLAQDGVVFLNEGYGLADRAQDIPNTPGTRFHLASMSKQFTAMAILILQSQGKLNIQDPICNHMISCPEAWQDITIHQLLTHTSGLSPELYDIVGDAARDPEASSDPAYYIEIAGEVPLETRPGEQYDYNNFGYTLLAHIIEQASGQSYADFLQENIFSPLNMRDSGYEDSSTGGAVGYTYRYDTTGVTYEQWPISDGEGQLYSTTGDLYLWDQALYTDQLLPQAELEPMFERFVPQTIDVPGFGWGYGWLVTRLLGQPLVAGAGGSGAHSTFYIRYPVDGLTLIVLMNQGDIDHMSVLLAIAGALFLSDLIFVITAIAFLLLLAVLLAAQKNHRVKTTWVIGVLWLLLAVPFALVFSRYLAEGRSVWTLLPLSLVLLYMLVKALLDFVFRIDFRRNRITRLAYLVLECLALFSLIWIAFSIHPSWGTPVLIAFGILAASLIFMYRNIMWRFPMKRQISVLLHLFILLLLTACSVPPQESTIPSTLPWIEEEVSFTFGHDELYGILTLPTGEGSYPAIVIISGSTNPSTGTRDGVSAQYHIDHAHQMVLSGFAVLRYDPPGVGESGGGLGIESLDSRTEEAVAALHFLQSRADIQPDRVGLWSDSQGAWVIAMAAAGYPQDVAFIISVSGSGVPVADQQVFSIQAQSEAAGMSEEDITKAVLFGRLLIDWQLVNPIYRETNEAGAQVLGDGPWTSFMALVYEPGEITPAEGLQTGIEILESIQDEPWARFLYLRQVYIPQLESIPPEQVEVLKAIAGQSMLNDPEDYLTRVHCPVLAFFGEDDVLQPTERSAALYELYLSEAGNEDFEIVVIPNVGHSITLSISAYGETLSHWLDSLYSE